MVFKMFSTGSHTRKINNRKFIKNDNYVLKVNPNNKGLVKLYTKQKDGIAYNSEFNNQEDFMKNFLDKDNDRSLFKMNKRLAQQTKKQKPKKQKPNSYYKTRFKQLQKKQQKQQKQQKKQKQQTEKIKRQIKYLQRSLS